MSDLMQLLADIANKSTISKIWVDLLIRPVMIMIIYMCNGLNGNQIDLYIIIAAVEQMLPYMLCARK